MPINPVSFSLTKPSQYDIAQGAEHYNILQNNGRWAHQEVDHVHFHIIPKPAKDDAAGLGITWPGQGVSEFLVASLLDCDQADLCEQLGMDDIKKTYEEIKAKLD